MGASCLKRGAASRALTWRPARLVIGAAIGLLACSSSAQPDAPSAKTPTQRKAAGPNLGTKGVPMLKELWRGEALEGTYRLACDSESDGVYWLRNKGLGRPSELYRLAAGARTPELVATETQSVRGMVFDPQYVYLTAIDRVLRVPRRPGGPVEVLARGEPQASDLVLSGEHLCWTNPAFPPGIHGPPRGPLDGTVRRMKKTGGEIATILSGEDTLKLVGHDDADLYLATAHGLIALPLRGGSSRMLLRDERSAIASGLARGEYVYLTSGGELRRVPKRGGAATILARAQILLDVAILGQQIYVARNVAYDRGVVAQKAAVLRLELSGGEAVELAGLTFTPLKLAAGTATLCVLDGPMLGHPGTPRLLVLGRKDDAPPPAPKAGARADVR
jgi:hypothetical protein